MFFTNSFSQKKLFLKDSFEFNNYNLKKVSSQNINSLYKFDTSINTGIHLDFKNFNTSNYNLTLKNDFIYIYSISYTEDTLHFLSIDLNTKKISNILLFHKNISDIIKTPFIKFFDIDENYLAIFSSYNNLIVYDRKNNNKIVIDTLYSQCAYDGGKIINNILCMYKCYNTHPKECSQSIRLSKINIDNKAIVYDTFLNSESIAFSHFSPSQFIDIDNKGNFFYTNSVDPKIIKIGSKEIQFKLLIDSSWHKFNPKILNLYNTIYSSEYNPKQLIDFLSPYEDSISRIERISLVNDSTLHLVKIPSNNKIKGRIRNHDIYKIKDNELQPIFIDYIESNISENMLISKDNIPLLSSQSKNCILKNGYFIRLDPRPTNSKIGLSRKDYNKVIEASKIENFRYYIDIYKLNPLK